MVQGIDFLVSSGYARCYSHVAEMLGVKEASVSNWRTGRSSSTIEIYNKVMDLVKEAQKFLEDASKMATSIHENIVAVNSEPMIKAEAVCNALRLRLVQAINELDYIDNDQRQRLTKLILEV